MRHAYLRHGSCVDIHTSHYTSTHTLPHTSSFPPPPLDAVAAIIGETPEITNSSVVNATEGVDSTDLFKAATAAASLGLDEADMSPNGCSKGCNVAARGEAETDTPTSRTAGRRGVRDASVFRAEWVRLVRRYSRGSSDAGPLVRGPLKKRTSKQRPLSNSC